MESQIIIQESKQKIEEEGTIPRRKKTFRSSTGGAVFSKEQEKLQFMIQDTGCGISKENIDKLFKFYCKDKLNNRDKNFNIQGFGLGLIMSHEILKFLDCDKHSKINVESKLGEGTIFKFAISTAPIEEQVHSKAGQILESLSAVEYPKTRKKWTKKINELAVLVVEDEPFCADVVLKYLEWLEISSVLTANNGQEAISIIKNEAIENRYFDLVVMDCNMPLMNGFEASINIRKLIKSKEIKDLIIVALTANVATANERACKEAGMDMYLSKPVSMNVFKQTIIDVLKKINKE